MNPEAAKRAGERLRQWHEVHTAPKYGKYWRLSNDRLFGVWRGMCTRCENEDSYAYRNYGAKGVRICDEWHDYFVFREWALSTGYDYDAPRGQCTLDRINPFGNYEPSNCRWADWDTQQHNKRRDWLKAHPDYQPA